MVAPVRTAVAADKDLPHDEVRLVALIERRLDGHDLTAAVLRPEGLALSAGVVADNGVRRVQNVLRGAVVLLKADRPRPVILLLEVQDILDIRAAEAVDALVVVADDADVAVAPREQPRQQILQVVRVLILVDEDIAELPLVVFACLAVALQQAHRVQDDVVEVEGVRLAELAVIARIDLADARLAPVAALFPIGRELLGALHGVLRVRDDRQQLSRRERLFIQLQLLEDVLEDALAVVGVVDGEAAVKADLVDVAAQDAHACGMERRGPDVLRRVAEHPLQPLLELVGSLVGEGDGQHLPRPGGLHGAQILRQRLLLGVRVLRILLQKLHLIF